MNYRKIGNDKNLIRLGQKYFVVNNYTLQLILSYQEHADLKSLSSCLGYSEHETNKIYKELNQALNAAEYFEEDLEVSTPLKVQWRLTDLCNLKCKHCYLGNKNNVELSSSELIKIANKIISANVMEVTLTGGEPLMVKVLPELIYMFLNKNILVNVFTNGMLTESLIEKFNMMPNRSNLRFNISIDGLQETHENIRGIGTYQKLINNIKLLVANGYIVTTNTTLTALNYTEIPQLILAMKQIGVRTFQISNLINLGWAIENDYLKMDKEKTVIFESKIRELSEVCNDDFRFLYSPIPNNTAKENPTVFKIEKGKIEQIGTDIWRCGAGKGKITISVNGDVLCCPFFSNYIIGNILDDDLENIWNNSVRHKFNHYLNKINGRKRICAALKGAYNVC